MADVHSRFQWRSIESRHSVPRRVFKDVEPFTVATFCARLTTLPASLGLRREIDVRVPESSTRKSGSTIPFVTDNQIAKAEMRLAVSLGAVCDRGNIWCISGG
jgi:hypothetical protein